MKNTTVDFTNRQLAKLFGLPIEGLAKFTLTAKPNHMPVIEAEYIILKMDKITSVIKKYEIENFEFESAPNADAMDCNVTDSN